MYDDMRVQLSLIHAPHVHSPPHTHMPTHPRAHILTHTYLTHTHTRTLPSTFTHVHTRTHTHTHTHTRTGVGIFLANIVQNGCFGYAGEKLTERVRQMFFKVRVMHMDIYIYAYDICAVVVVFVVIVLLPLMPLLTRTLSSLIHFSLTHSHTQVAEQGTHDELMLKGALYAHLVSVCIYVCGYVRECVNVCMFLCVWSFFLYLTLNPPPPPHTHTCYPYLPTHT